MLRKIGCFLLGFSSLVGSCPELLEKPEDVKPFGELRVKTITGWDQLLTWALSPQLKEHTPKWPYTQLSFRNSSSDLKTFVKNYGYFSYFHPIVGIVTDKQRDIEVVNCLLEGIHNQIPRREQLKFATEEILTKVVAYRELKKGMKITLSDSKEKFQTYVVDEVIGLWGGMPAFGLVPMRRNGIAPILLFRGTDLDLTTEKGWASVLSDLDVNGPGLRTFLRGRTKIHNWLKRVKKEYGPAKAVGFSLGGAFVLYTMIYEGGLLNANLASIAFNPPGVSKEVLEKWEGQEFKPPHAIYINEGDFVSQIGYFPSNVWLISVGKPMGVIEAHVSLISAKPNFTLTAVDTAE